MALKMFQESQSQLLSVESKWKQLLKLYASQVFRKKTEISQMSIKNL